MRIGDVLLEKSIKSLSKSSEHKFNKYCHIKFFKWAFISSIKIWFKFLKGNIMFLMVLV